MQHEVLSLLASHGTPLLQSKLLHPGEISSLRSLSIIAASHKRIAIFTSTNQKTTALSALSSTITTRVVRPYSNKILQLEELILRGELGLEGNVPLALVSAEMNVFEGLLNGVGRLLTALEAGPPGTSGKSLSKDQIMELWTASPLITLLQSLSYTGLTSLAELLLEAVAAISNIWLASFTSFLIWGRLGKEPLVNLTPADPNSTTSSLPTYTFPPSSLPILPTISNPNTRLSLIASLSTICTSLSILHSLPNNNSSISSRSKTASHSLELSRGLRHRLESILEGCTGPGDESFLGRISQIEALLSTHLLSFHLPTHLLLSNLALMGSTYLLRTGSFSSNLVNELSILRTKPRSTNLGISTVDLTGALFRASLGTELDSEEEIINLSSLTLENFKLVLSRDIENEEDDAFSRKLLGPSISLKFEPTRALGLILNKESLIVYGRIWSYLLSIKSCQSRLLKTWSTLSHSQRLRRRFTGASEGGQSAAEIALRESTIRNAWGLVRSMIWFIDSILGHFQIDVIEVAHKNLLDRIEKGKLGGNTGESEELGGEEGEGRTTRSETEGDDATTQGGETSTTDYDRSQQRSQQLDFNSLTTIHSLYLSVIISGLLLNSESLTSKIMEMLETCESFCGKVDDRWNGDILPGLLEGSLNDEESAQVVFERRLIIQELNESFQSHLEEFFELLSFASTTNPRQQQPNLNASISHANLSIASLSIRGIHSKINKPHSFHTGINSSSSTLIQNPIVASAKLEAELATREFFSRLLMRLDFAGWFSRREERLDRIELRQIEKLRESEEGGILEGLR